MKASMMAAARSFLPVALSTENSSTPTAIPAMTATGMLSILATTAGAKANSSTW